MSLLEGRDYYIEKGKYVFTAYYLKSRGYCCNSGCRHCPYRAENPVKTDNGKPENELNKRESIKD